MFKKLAFIIMLIISCLTLSIFVGGVQAQAETLPPLTDVGPYGVRAAVMNIVDTRRANWSFPAYIWYPADKTKEVPPAEGNKLLKNAPPDKSAAPYPLIIYSHGWLGSPAELMSVMQYLASQGYVVTALQHHDTSPMRFELVDRPLDITLLLDNIAAIKDGELVGMIDTNNVGIMGYSQGAETALQMLGLIRDPVHFASWCADHPDLKSWDCTPPPNISEPWPLAAIADYRAQLGLETTPTGQWAPFSDERIQAVLAMAPGDFPLTTEDMLAAVTTPTMILHGTRDTYCDYEGNAVQTYNHLGTKDRYLVTLFKGGHEDISSFLQIPKHFATAFFGYYLQHDQDYLPYLSSDPMPELHYPGLFWGPYEND